MKISRSILSLLTVAFAATWNMPMAHSEESDKLRENLRAAMLQARDLQNKVSLLEAQNADNALTIQDLEAKLASTQKRSSDDKQMADRAIQLLEENKQDLEGEIGRLSTALEKWKSSHKEATGKLQKTEMERAKLSKEKSKLEQIVTDQRMKNHEMFKLGMEVLDRYKNHAFGDAILAREPFTGNMRARFQTLVQDLGEKMHDQRIRPEGTTTAAASSPAKP